MSKEMKRRGKAYGNYRYRRFQALDDALSIYFHMSEYSGTWFTVSDICDKMEWDETNKSTRRRVRRICESLKRVHRVEIRNNGKARGPFVTLFIRVLE